MTFRTFLATEINKNFQKKEWSKEKNKLNDLKEKVLEK